MRSYFSFLALGLSLIVVATDAATLEVTGGINATGQVCDSNGCIGSGGGGGGNVGAIIVTGEPFLLANALAYSVGGSNGAEARNRFAAPRDGTIQNLFVVPNQALAAGSEVVVTVRVNGADTALAVTLTPADGVIGKGNAVNFVNVSQGDLISVQFEETQGVNSTANVRASFEYL
jgi:hypothetical protein